MKNLNLKIFLLFIAIVLTNNAIARIKCWTNNEGNRECGDKIPPEYTQQGYKELDKSGLVREEKEKVKTKAELEEAKKQAENIKKRNEKKKNQKAYDKMLLETYTNVKEIEIARDEKINAIQSTIKLTKKRVSKLQYQLNEQLSENDDSKESKKIKNLQDKISLNENFIQKKINEQEEIKNLYIGYIKRLKQLKNY